MSYRCLNILGVKDSKEPRSNFNILQNEYILTSIFHVLDVTTLKEARLVCTIWRETAFPVIKRRVVLRPDRVEVELSPQGIQSFYHHTDPNLLQGLIVKGKVGKANFGDYLTRLRTNQKVGNFQLSNNLRRLFIWNWVDFFQFAPCITQGLLKMLNELSVDNVIGRKPVNLETNTLPNLKKLTLRTTDHFLSFDIPIFALATSNIENLSVEGNHLKVCRLIRLKRFTCKSVNSSRLANDVMQMIYEAKDTLEFLSLLEVTIGSDLPVLPKLRELRFEEFSQIVVSPESALAQRFCNVKKLSLSIYVNELVSLFDKFPELSAVVRVLEVFVPAGEGAALGMFVERFRNLEVLTIVTEFNLKSAFDFNWQKDCVSWIQFLVNLNMDRVIVKTRERYYLATLILLLKEVDGVQSYPRKAIIEFRNGSGSWKKYSRNFAHAFVMFSEVREKVLMGWGKVVFKGY